MRTYKEIVKNYILILYKYDIIRRKKCSAIDFKKGKWIFYSREEVFHETGLCDYQK